MELEDIQQLTFEERLEALKDNSLEVLQNEVEVLAELGDKRAIEPIRALLGQETDPDMRFSIALALANLEDESVIEPLLKLLFEELDPYKRIKILEALATLHDSRAVKPLIEILTHIEVSDEEVLYHGVNTVRGRAARALGEIGGEGIYEILMTALTDNYWDVRSGAAYGLGILGDKRGVEPLIDILNNLEENAGVRRGAAVGLCYLRDPRAIEPIIEAIGTTGGHTPGVISLKLPNFGEAAVEPLIKALISSENSTIRTYTAMTLGDIGGTRAIEGLVAALRNKGVKLSPNAETAETLVEAGGYEAVESFFRLCENYNQDDRSRWENPALFEALGRAGKLWVVDLYLETVKQFAINILANIYLDLAPLGKPAMELLIKALQDSNSNVRAGAIIALGQFNYPQIVEPLVKLVDDPEKQVRQMAFRVLTNTSLLGKGRKIELATKLLSDEDAELRTEAEAGLEHIKQESF